MRLTKLPTPGPAFQTHRGAGEGDCLDGFVGFFFFLNFLGNSPSATKLTPHSRDSL